MSAFLIRLLVTIGIIWLTQFLITLFAIKPNIDKFILATVAIIMILFLIGIIHLPL